MQPSHLTARGEADRASLQPGGTPEYILRVRGLTKVYGNPRTRVTATALNGISLEVQARDFVSIMGPSGSGKSTLLNLLAGLDRPSAGEIWLQGQNMATLHSDQLALFRRRNLGFIFQDFNLLDTLTLAENVGLPLSLDGRKGPEIRERVWQVMDVLGLVSYVDRYPYEVSGGQQQRAAVARAVVHNPSLVLADEPTGNLDSASTRALLEVFQRLNRELASTILMVTHDPLTASFSRRIVFIKDGQVFTHLERHDRTQQQFFQEILNLLAHLEGDL